MIRGIEKKIDADKRGAGGIKSRIRFIDNLLSNEYMYIHDSVSVYLELCKLLASYTRLATDVYKM